jgi:hypothetical protein
VLEPGKAAGARTRRYADRPNRAQRAPLRGLSIYRAIASDADNPPAARPSAPRRRGATSSRPACSRKPSPEFPTPPRCVLAPRPSPPPSPRRNHAHPRRHRAGRAPRHSRDLKTARSLRQGEDHLSGIPRFGSEPRQNRSSATKGSRGMRSRVRRAAPVRFCWKRRHDMGSLIDICSSCSSPQVSA